jgi:DNA-binding MltR family transcriptional regulator
MTKMPVAPLDQKDVLEILARQTDAGNALVVAGLVEDELEKLLLGAGRELSNKTANGIFSGMGPLSSFSAKIEIAYMFNLIDKPVRDDLRVVTSIRNAFAHTTRSVHFGTEHIATECRKLSNWKDDIDNQECYRERARECVNLIKQKLDVFLFANALREEPSVDLDEDAKPDRA